MIDEKKMRFSMNYHSCRRSKTLLPLYSLFCFLLLCLYTANNYTSTSSLFLSLSFSGNKFFFNLEADAHNNEFKNIEKKTNIMEIGGGARRVLLGGPGSAPPHCTSKCGGCTPCKAVHVAVPPGVRMPTEYYPEAWRCKCGNKLYIP